MAFLTPENVLLMIQICVFCSVFIIEAFAYELGLLWGQLIVAILALVIKIIRVVRTQNWPEKSLEFSS